MDSIGQLNAEENIELLDWQAQEEISQLMQQADILMAPSVTCSDGDQKGIPVVLMEAFSQGLPVISTFHGGIPELQQRANQKIDRIPYSRKFPVPLKRDCRVLQCRGK